MSESLRLRQSGSVLLIVDIQERLAAAMHAGTMASVVRNTSILLEAAKRMAIPVVLSEQYPKGLGATVSGLADGLAALATLHRLEKLVFSVCAADGFTRIVEQLADAGRKQWIVAGMETHICVYQSVRSLVERGDQVHVVADAVVSRTKQNYRIGLGLSERSGAAISSTETVVMDLLSCAQGDDFKAISKLIR